ncbi:MAG: xylose isomerase [Opitutaceae bacterium]|nr:xylose isomerase [Opitutaceae bacterium]
MKDFSNSKNSINRRQAIGSTGALFAGLCVSPLAQAIKPITRASRSPLKLSLAAYSMRKYLPDTRRNPKAEGEMDMLGFVDYAATLGVEGAELTSYFMPSPLTDPEKNALKLRAHVLGLDISGGAIGNNFTYNPGSEEGLAQMRYTREWIDHYADIGTPVIRVFGGKPPSSFSEKKAVQNIITNMRIACDYAGDKGVVLAMENHDFLIDIGRMLPIIEAIDSPWFGVCFDSGNIAPTSNPYKELARIAPYSVNAQIKVEIPVNGKKEHTDLARIINILKNANYRGYVTLEYESSEDPYKAIPKYLKKLRGLISLHHT